MKENKAYLLIGGNQGHREAYLARASKMLAESCGAIDGASAIYQTAAWGLQAQDAFLNQALAITTFLRAAELLKTILDIEAALGRRRDVKYGPRVIDIDIIFFNNEVIEISGLTVPHPQAHNRRFVLEPLCDIAAGYVHPLFDQTVAQLLQECPDTLAVQKIQAAD